MKKLLSSALNRWFCYALVLLCSATYAQPCTFNDVIERTIIVLIKNIMLILIC